MTKDLISRRNKILAVRRAIKNLRAKEGELLNELQKNCPHEIIIGVPYKKILDVFPPRYICVFCGLEKEGWKEESNDFEKRAIKMVSSDNEFYKFRELVELAEKMMPIISVG